MPHFTIITPTIQRDSLIRTCESVDSQTCASWEHIVVVDRKDKPSVLDSIQHPQRKVIMCEEHHHNGGNTCRHNAWAISEGKYLYYLDDDNYFADKDVLEDLKTFTGNWGLFPILSFGQKFYNDPPRLNFVDTANILVRRDIGRWPNIDDWASDGIFIEELVKQYTYEAFPDFRPIAVTHIYNS